MCFITKLMKGHVGCRECKAGPANKREFNVTAPPPAAPRNPQMYENEYNDVKSKSPSVPSTPSVAPPAYETVVS